MVGLIMKVKPKVVEVTRMLLTEDMLVAHIAASHLVEDDRRDGGLGWLFHVSEDGKSGDLSSNVVTVTRGQL